MRSAWASDHIGEPSPRLLKPPKAGPGSNEGDTEIYQQSKPVWSFAPNQDGASLLYDEGERIHQEQKLVVLGKRADRVENGREKQQHHGDDGDGLPHVTHIDPKR